MTPLSSRSQGHAMEPSNCTGEAPERRAHELAVVGSAAAVGQREGGEDRRVVVNPVHLSSREKKVAWTQFIKRRASSP